MVTGIVVSAVLTAGVVTTVVTGVIVVPDVVTGVADSTVVTGMVVGVALVIGGVVSTMVTGVLDVPAELIRVGLDSGDISCCCHSSGQRHCRVHNCDEFSRDI